MLARTAKEWADEAIIHLKRVQSAARARVQTGKLAGVHDVETLILLQTLADAVKNASTPAIALARRLGDLNTQYSKRAF